MARNRLGERVIVLSVVIDIVVTIAVILRFLARRKSKADVAIDDVLLVVSVIPQYVMVVLGVLVVRKGGMGLPFETLSKSQVAHFLKFLMSGIVTYSLTITLVRISLLLLYRRIFSTAAFRKKSVFVGVLCVIWFTITVCMDIFQCRPFDEAFHAETIFTNHCIDLQKFYWGATAANLGIDVIMLFLPLHMVWKLRLPTHQKLLLSGLFMLGGVVCIAGAMRIYYVGDLQKEDITVTTAAEYTWCQIEPATAILCACIVTYRPLFSSINLNFSRISSFFSNSSTTSSGDGWRATEDGRNSPHRQWPASRGLQGRDGLRLHNLDAMAIDVNIKPHRQEVNTDLYPRSRTPQNVVIKDVQMKRARLLYHSKPLEANEDQIELVNHSS